MKREIRDMKDTASSTFFTATALTFDDSSSNTIAYNLSGGNGTRGSVLVPVVAAMLILLLVGVALVG